MIRLYFILTTLTFFISAANAQMGGGGMAAPLPVPEVDEETLIFQIPEKWYPYSKDSEAKVDVYIFPTGSDPKKWKELVQLETFTSKMGITDSSQVYDLKTGALENACNTHNVTSDKDRDENSYSMHQWTERCTTGDTETVTIRKAILGNDKFYLASKVWKYEPKDWEVEKWTDYMNQVYVCDGTSEHNCNPPNGRGGGGGGGMGR